MSIVLGVHVGVDEVSAVLAEADLPELGPIAARSVSIASAPGGVGDAVTTMLGIMRVQAAQNDLLVTGSAVVCDNLMQCEIVRAALVAHSVRDVEVVDASDPRLADEHPLDIAAALIGATNAATTWTGEPDAEGIAADDEGWSLTGGGRREAPRSARLTMIGLGVAVLAALSGATVWALTATGPSPDGLIDTADTTELPSSGGDAIVAPPVAAVADSTSALPGPSTVPPLEAGLTYGPVPVGSWSEAAPAGPISGSAPVAEVSSGSGNSGGGDSGVGDSAGGNPGGGGDGGGGNSGADNSGDDDGDSGGGDSGGGDSEGGDSDGEETPNVDPSPEPEPEVPSTEPTTTTDAPVTTEPTSTDPEPSENPVE